MPSRTSKKKKQPNERSKRLSAGAFWRIMRASARKEPAVPLERWEPIEPTSESSIRDSRSALEWVIDQYQVSTDKRNGIVSDPNRPDEEEYIVRLIGRVLTVSLETVQYLIRLREIPLPLG